jgi:hypothetical protein
MTPEQLKKQKEDKALADKTSYMALAKWHDQEADRYRQKADDCVEVGLVPAASPGQFGGL